MYYQFGAVLIFVALGVVFIFGNLLIGAVARLSKKSEAKEAVYECGEPTIGSAWIRYNSRFYNIALVYLLFDVEVIVLIPAVIVVKEMVGLGMGTAVLLAILGFLFLLVLGLIYEWVYGNLDWIRRADNSEAIE